jgi:hypothetical protein
MPFAKKTKYLVAVAILMLPSLLALYVYVRLQAQKHPITSSERLRGVPKIILWAWERPEDLNFIDPREVGVGVLAMTVQLKDEQIHMRPRQQPLQIPKGTYLIAVTRIETDKQSRPAFSAEQRNGIIAVVVKLLANPRVTAVQIDFDAAQSEREFYRELLVELRKHLPETMPLSITALASWCLYDDWIAGLAADEAVPMLFRMGLDSKQVVNRLEAGGDFRPEIARQSLGISTDEPLPRLPSGRRVYIFTERPWSAEAANRIIEEVRQWQ